MAAVAIVAFASIQALTTALRSGSGPIPISLGGGLVGVAVAVALGGLGLALRNTLRSEAGRKRVKRIGATVVGVVLVGFGVIYYLEERETAANRARHERQVAQSHRYWPVLASSLPQDLPLLRRNIEAAPPDRILMWLTVADNDELKLTAFFSGVSPCVEVVSKSPIVREGLRSQLGTGAVTKSEGATTFEWNGQRGEIRACLGDADFEDTDDWPRQHEWYAEMFEPFVAAGRSG
jgi:hypothetical protein